MNVSQKALTAKASLNYNALRLVIAFSAIAAASACATSPRSRQEKEPNFIEQASVNRTLLDAYIPQAVAVEARMILAAPSGAQGLNAQEYAQLTAFAADYVQLGRGNVVISVPANAGNSPTAALIAQEAQRVLYAGGVDFAKMSGGAYQAQGQPNAPVTITFGRYEAQQFKCKPWSEIDPRKTADNQPVERFGCTQNANLAAMVADPADLLGDRKDGAHDAARGQVGIDMYRKDAVPVVSGSVAGGGGQ
jgi:pilus assembly protein CpaD